MITIGIIGGGFVGSATALLECEEIRVLIWDVLPERRKPLALTYDAFCLNCDAYFICVPTPRSTQDASSCLEYVDSALGELFKQGCFINTPIFLRSTVPVGTCDRYELSSFPEFLTERNWRQDFISTSKWICGAMDDLDGDFLANLLQVAHKHGKIESAEIVLCKPSEAEMVKYARNCFLATKVAYFNELSAFCERKELDFESVRSMIVQDERIGESHSRVPGPDGKKGFGGTCFPKDLSSLIWQMCELAVQCPILQAVEERNTTLDRK